MEKSDTPREVSAASSRAGGARRLGVEEGNDDDGADSIRSIRRVPAPTPPPAPSLPTARAMDPGSSRGAQVAKPISTPDSGTRARTRRPA